MNNLLPDNQTSTWSQDCARGLMHPDSVAAREARIALHKSTEQSRAAILNSALSLLRETVRNDADVVQVLYALSATLARHHGPTSYMHPTIRAIDDLTCKLEEA